MPTLLKAKSTPFSRCQVQCLLTKNYPKEEAEASLIPSASQGSPGLRPLSSGSKALPLLEPPLRRSGSGPPRTGSLQLVFESEGQN